MRFIRKGMIALQRTLARWKAVRDLRCLSPARRMKNAPVVFAVMRNEMLRLQAFLRHYRQLGIEQFVIVDNNSTDETGDYLKSQKDVLLYSTEAHFTGKEAWLDYLFHKHGLNNWCLVADADELIDYPSSNLVTLPDLCRYLDETGANALHSILLDLYPEGSLSQINYTAGDVYFSKKWYFDPMDSMVMTPRHFYRGSGLDFRFEGGVRKRLFGVSSCCSKFAFFRFTGGMFLSDGQHYLEGGRFAELRAVLYHMKYLQDFEARVLEETQREQHWKGAVEYKAYAKLISSQEHGLIIKDETSVLLLGTRQLEELGFMLRPPSYDAFVKRVEGRGV